MSDEELLEFMEEEGGGYSVKTLVIDCADNWGFGGVGGCRELDLTNGGSKILLTQADYTADATTFSAGYDPKYMFDTSLSLIDQDLGVGWRGNPTNQRIYCLYDDIQTFDGLMLNNFVFDAAFTDIGVQNVKIYITETATTNTVYGDPVPGGTLIFDGVFPEHAALNEAQDFPLTLIG